MNRILKIFCLFLITTLIFSACSDYNKLLKSDNVDKKYEAALKYYEKKDYYRAGTLLDEVRPLLAGRPEAETAEYLYAYTQYNEGLFQVSAQLFRTFYAVYGNSPNAEEALFMHAKSLYKDSPEYSLDQTSTQTAIVSIQEFLNRYPESKFKDDATKMYDELAGKLERKAFETAKLYYQMGKSQLTYYQAAVTAFNNFEREYPASNYNEEAAYYRILAQFYLAEESIEEKQRERYFDTVGLYQAFVDKYPKSKFLRDAENIYDKSSKQLERIKSSTTANTAKAQ
ncbi:outer membrane protein assembly factor BamD [Adhaeribacter aquaticus]|uniref:outer membrane protein assembly factor BamD n=1 Tax=Adhaeribacter aquaticus TaxID=299567 RepID=UPI00040BEE70|nr:outer membrane protein assembly factor BamD [Adhaeribacter aquaticus]